MNFLLLAQDLPDASVLADAQNVQQVLAWIIAALMAVIGIIVAWHIKTLGVHKADLKELTDKREADHGKMMKLALRVQSALEAWAGLKKDLVEE